MLAVQVVMVFGLFVDVMAASGVCSGVVDVVVAAAAFEVGVGVD